jgi:ankyrin repeat protein
VGYILSKFNNESVENIDSTILFNKIITSPSPHLCEFKRYDFRYDFFSETWNSLQTLRDLKICLDNPLLSISDFISLAGRGEYKKLKNSLVEGHDPDLFDLSGCNAMLNAVSNNKLEIVKLLLEYKANVNCRDKNVFIIIIILSLLLLIFYINCSVNLKNNN